MKLIDKDAIFPRENLDVLFIALNPPVQSNNRGTISRVNNPYFLNSYI